MTTELTMLAWTVILGLVQVIGGAQFDSASNGLAYGMSPRDTPPPNPLPQGSVGARWQRATRNLLETFAFAAAAILIATAAGRHNGYTIWGAQLYFWCRLVYLPLYLAGIPVIRTLVFLASVLGIVLVLVGLVTGQ